MYMSSKRKKAQAGSNFGMGYRAALLLQLSAASTKRINVKCK